MEYGMKRGFYFSILFTVGAAVTLSSCATFEGAEDKKNLDQLKTGMSQAKVLNLLGTPDSVVREPAKDRWVYEFRTGNKKGRHFFLDFKNNELSQTGDLNGREVAAEEESRTPGTCTQWTNPEETNEPLCIQ